MSLNNIPKSRINTSQKCQVCTEAKMTRSFFPSVVEKNIEPLGLVHTDVCGLKICQTRRGKRYFITFIDDCTRYCYVYLLRSKDEAFEIFKIYKAEVENQLG